jgi:hypothetical protein
MRLPSRLQAQSGHAINPLPRPHGSAPGLPAIAAAASPKPNNQQYQDRWVMRATIDTMIRDDDDDHRETDDQTWT